MRKLSTILKWIGYILAGFALLLLILFIYLYRVSITNPPEITDHSAEQLQRTAVGNNFYYLGNSWFRKSKSGLYELYVEGNDFERGVINGKLTKELVQRQEDHFSAQIEKIIPSTFYRHFLKYFIGWFNRDLAKQVKEEYKREIYGVSMAASDKYNYIGSPYQRILNYHAAHDIGHALQSMALVGCTSFGTWNDHSADSSFIIGRNFDFYVGDKFAEDKIVAFFKPTKGNGLSNKNDHSTNNGRSNENGNTKGNGHSNNNGISNGYGYMTVTWGGFTGAVSGMNEAGLTVTINAAKTAIPSGSATPVSLVAREILQYAGNIAQALQIARSRHMFVSESFLVGSAADNKAVIIEKTPDSLDVYDPQQNFIVCANHFQSKGLVNSVANTTQVKESASAYRYQRVMELLNQDPKNTVEKTIAILRDTKGLQGADIGMGNEKAINQLIAHHSIVFEPKKRLVWVSTAPWQEGSYVCYDLNKVFSLRGLHQDQEIIDSTRTIAADTMMKTPAFASFQKFRSYKQRILDGGAVDPDSIIASNPNYYHAYVLAGDMAATGKRYAVAKKYYQAALTKEIATQPERLAISKKLDALKEKE